MPSACLNLRCYRTRLAVERSTKLHTLIWSRLDPRANQDYDSGVNRTTGVIARSLIHVESANDPKEAGDANGLLQECVVEPDFDARVAVSPRQSKARLLRQAFTVFELISWVSRQTLRGRSALIVRDWDRIDLVSVYDT
jgi:hypothetical protein